MSRSLILAAVAMLAMPGLATAQATGDSTQRIRSVTVKSGEACPPSTDEEIVVCTTLEDPYRIPKAVRDSGPVTPSNQSWVNRAAALDETGRKAGGLPDTCSPVGTGGQSGCFRQSAGQFKAAKRAAKRAEDATP